MCTAELLPKSSEDFFRLGNDHHTRSLLVQSVAAPCLHRSAKTTNAATARWFDDVFFLDPVPKLLSFLAVSCPYFKATYSWIWMLSSWLLRSCVGVLAPVTSGNSCLSPPKLQVKCVGLSKNRHPNVSPRWLGWVCLVGTLPVWRNVR